MHINSVILSRYITNERDLTKACTYSGRATIKIRLLGKVTMFRITDYGASIENFLDNRRYYMKNKILAKMFEIRAVKRTPHSRVHIISCSDSAALVPKTFLYSLALSNAVCDSPSDSTRPSTNAL